MGYNTYRDLGLYLQKIYYIPANAVVARFTIDAPLNPGFVASQAMSNARVLTLQPGPIPIGLSLGSVVDMSPSNNSG